MFLRKRDLLIRMRDRDLTQLLDGVDTQTLERTLQEAELRFKAHVPDRFDLDALMPSIVTPYALADQYVNGELIELLADAYNALTAYDVDNLVSFTDGFVYKNILGSTGVDPTNPTNWVKWGTNEEFYLVKSKTYVSTTSYIPGDVVFFTDGEVYKNILATTDENEDPTNATFWTLVVGQGFAQDPQDTVQFTEGDSRDQLAVGYTVDLALYDLHSLINPRNVPEFRVMRRDDVMSFMKKVNLPKNNITPDNWALRVFIDPETNDLTGVWGSVTKINHDY